MFEVGDKVRLKTPDEIEDWDNFPKAVKETIQEFQDKVLTISSFSNSRYAFDECSLLAKDKGIVLVAKRPEEPTIEEFESLF